VRGQVTSSDFYFDISASKKDAGFVNGVLHKYDFLLDGSNDPNIVHFGANGTTDTSAIDPTSNYLGQGAHGQTLTFTGGQVTDGTITNKGVITDDFTLLYYQGHYSLFDL
jgi:hypothetical protein